MKPATAYRACSTRPSPLRSVLPAITLPVGAVVVAAVITAVAPEAMAQFGQETKSPPTPSSSPNPPLLIQYGVLLVLVLGVLGLSIIRSKREVQK